MYNGSQLTRAEIKQEAKNALSGKWGTGVLMCLIFFGINMVLNFIPVFGAIAMLVIGPPLGLGLAMVAMRLLREGNADIENLFDGFKYFTTAFVTGLLKGLIILAWSLLAIVSFILAFVFSLGGGSGFLILIPVSLLLMVPGYMAYYSYSQTSFILAEDPMMPATEVLKASKAMMQGNRLKFFVMQLSFIGWYFLCALSLGIGFLWLMPYYYVSTAVFYEQLKGTGSAPLSSPVSSKVEF